MKTTNVKRTLCAILAAGMALSLASCGDNGGSSTPSSSTPSSTGSTAATDDSKTTAEDDPFLTGEKPELNLLYYYQAYDMNTEPPYAMAEEITGYKVKWYLLPQENATQKLMLEIAGGTSYDWFMRGSGSDVKQLKDQNALTDLGPLLDKYGENVKKAASELSWSVTTDDSGMIYGIPHEAFNGSSQSTYGTLKGGIGFRSDELEALGKELPTNIDEFYEILKAYHDKTGNAALTMSKGGWQGTIMAAFGMGDPFWYDVNGTLVPRIKMDGVVDYLAFMQKLYSEGLLDNDMPINAYANAQEKYSSDNALCMPMMFWDIPAMKAALEANNPDASNLFATWLAPSATEKATVYVAQGIANISVIPKTAKNPEHAMIWFNALADTEAFRKVYIGEEGVSYKVENGSYYPIFTDDENDMDFSKYTNSDKFTTVTESSEVFKMWQARARKTPEMAAAYEQMNSRVGDYNYVDYYESYITGMPTELAALQNDINDALIKAIAEGTDAQTVVNDLIAMWDKGVGPDCEKIANDWYSANKDKLNVAARSQL